MRHLTSLYLLLFLYGLPCIGQQQSDLIIDAQFQAMTLEQILEDLETDYPVHFYYKKEWLPTSLITFSVEDETLENVLSELLARFGLHYATYENYAVLITREEMEAKSFSREFFEARDQLDRQFEENTAMVIIGDSLNLNPSGKASVKIKLTDPLERAPIIGALVFIEELNISSISDGNGTVDLEIPLGQHEVGIQSIGFHPTVKRISVFNDGDWDLELRSQSYTLGEVVIQERRNDDNFQAVSIGLEALSAKEIQQLPSFLGEADVIRSILSLPGVSTVGEGSSGFNVRGGNIDQNLILQDGAPIFNASHALGFYSIFNPDAVSQVKLYKGYIPAYYGGRLSSVLDVNLKDGDYEKLRMNGGIGPLASRVTMNGPIVKEKTSFLLGARAAYPNWILKQVENEDVNDSRASFYDVNAKVNQKIGKSGNLMLSFYQSNDLFRFANDYGFSWKTRTGTFQWNQIIKPGLSSSLSASAGQLLNNFFDPEGTDAFDLDNGISYYKLKQNFFLTPGNEHNVHFGAELTHYRSEPEDLRPRGVRSTVIPTSINKGQGRELGLYVNDEFVLNADLSFAVGLRFSLYQQLGPGRIFNYEADQPLRPENILDSIRVNSGEVVDTYSGFEPRFSFRWIVGKNNSLKLSYNRLQQFIHLISNSTAATPADIWQVSTQYIPPQISDNYSLGYYRNFKQNTWESSIEFYYKDVRQLVEYKDFSQLLINENLETELLIGKGRAYGFEFALKRKVGEVTGSMSYTYARSLRKVDGPSPEERINRGEWFPSNFDKPHTLNVNVKWQASKRGFLSVFFNYSSGRPVTVPTANYFQGTVVLPHYSDRNQFRVRNYHRMDIAYTLTRKAVRRSKYKGSLTFSVYNVYFRRNAFSVFFEREPNRAFSAFQLSVLGTAFPAMTYNFKF